jgi:hypothetical protein
MTDATDAWKKIADKEASKPNGTFLNIIIVNSTLVSLNNKMFPKEIHSSTDYVWLIKHKIVSIQYN